MLIKTCLEHCRNLSKINMAGVSIILLHCPTISWCFINWNMKTWQEKVFQFIEDQSRISGHLPKIFDQVFHHSTDYSWKMSTYLWSCQCVSQVTCAMVTTAPHICVSVSHTDLAQDKSTHTSSSSHSFSLPSSVSTSLETFKPETRECCASVFC